MKDHATNPESGVGMRPGEIVTTLESKPFLDDGRSAVQGLRRALAEVLAAVGADPSQPQEISRRFGLDKTLTWRITRVVREGNAWDAIEHIPRRPSIGIFVSAMSKHGASAERIDKLWRAMTEFERFVETHSGDRETLDMMVSVPARKSAAKRLEAFRKAGFQANSATWGVRAKIQLATHIMSPGLKPGHVDIGTVCGLVDFRRLRPNVPWAIASINSWRGSGSLEDEGLLGDDRPPIDQRSDGLGGTAAGRFLLKATARDACG